MDVLKRIIGSQKAIMALVGTLLAVFTAEANLEPIVTQAVATLFSLLIVVQGALDLKRGSPSDKTGEFAE